LITAAIWNAEHVDNMNFLKEVNYTEFTADVSVTATTVGTANQIVSSGAITYEAVPHLIECYIVSYSSPAQATFFILRDGTTVIGTIGWVGASSGRWPVPLRRRLTPSAASHTYNIAAWLAGAATGTVEAGTGGTAGNDTAVLPGYIRIRKIPT
jgi:hypothetical protein